MKTTQNAHSGPRWDPIRIFHGRETTFIVLLTENGYGRRVSTFNFMKSILFWTRLLLPVYNRMYTFVNCFFDPRAVRVLIPCNGVSCRVSCGVSSRRVVNRVVARCVIFFCISVAMSCDSTIRSIWKLAGCTSHWVPSQ